MIRPVLTGKGKLCKSAGRMPALLSLRRRKSPNVADGGHSACEILRFYLCEAEGPNVAD